MNVVGQYRPNYSILTQPLQGIIESMGLRTGVTNDHGTTDSAGNVTLVKCVRPGPTSRDFVMAGVAEAQVRRVMVNGIPVLDSTGNKWLRSNSANSTWDFFSHNAVFADLKWTVTMLMRSGFGSSPGYFNSIIGNNGVSASNRGFSIYSNDLSGTTTTIGHTISKGTAGFISISSDNSIMVPDTFDVWTFTFDGSLAAADRFKAYRNKTQQTLTVTSSSTATVTSPNHALEIFNIGNGPSTTGSFGQLAIVVMQSGVETQTVREAFIDSLEPIRAALNNHTDDFLHPYNYIKDAGTDYYLTAILAQNPLTPDTILKIYRKSSGGHVPDGNTFIYKQKSIDRGLTWDSETLWYDPGGVLGVGDLGGGYSSDGKLWIWTDIRTTNVSPQTPFSCMLLSSTDNADTAPTVTDLTSLMPADGNEQFAMHGQFVETSTGRYLFSFYTVKNDASLSANYAWFSDDLGVTWGTKTIRALAATHINETSLIIANSGGTERIISYIRHESNFEYSVFSSTNDGDTFTNDGYNDLGETFTVAAPGRFSKFSMYGVSVIAFWYCDRSSAPIFKVVYGKESDLASNPLLLDNGTKTDLRRRQLHYGTAIHPNGDLYSIGSYAEEPISPTLTENKMQTFFGGVQQKDLILTELGITKQ